MKFTPLGKLLVFLIGLGVVVAALVRFVPAAQRNALLARLRPAAATAGDAGRPTGGPARAASAEPPRLRLHGSNTIGKDLAPALAEGFLAKQGASAIRRQAGAIDEVTVEGVLPGAVDPVRIEIAAHGSSTAFEDLGRDAADIGMSSRRIKPEERRALASLGDLTSSTNEHVIGLDGVAIIVNRANPIDQLTVDQLRDLYSGRTTDWSAVGGEGGRVSLYARDDKSGTFDTFKQLVLRDQALAAGARRYEDSSQLAAELSTDSAGIGFVPLAYVGDAKALKISEGGSMAYRPTVFTVRTEEYRLSRRLYLYAPAAPREPWVTQFVNFALSNEGQAIVDSIGFVGQSLLDAPSQGALPATPELPPAYVAMTRAATRLALDFRFESGSDRLDNKALRDVGRLLESLSTPAHRDRKVLLLGFADARGTDEVNRRLSRARAESVARELESEGIRPAEITGFGSVLPVASNDTEEGRGHNRRVEIWLR